MSTTTTKPRTADQPEEVKKLVSGLNRDLSAEWGTVIRYTYQAGLSFGLVGAELRKILQAETLDEIEHARYLTDVIVDLGEEPTTTPEEFDKPSGVREMLELDLKLEHEAVENYTQRAREAEEAGLPGLRVKLEDMAADESEHVRQLRRILKGL